MKIDLNVNNNGVRQHLHLNKDDIKTSSINQGRRVIKSTIFLEKVSKKNI